MGLEGVTDEERHALFDHLEKELEVAEYGDRMYDKGYTTGYDVGYTIGYGDGYRKGIEEMLEKINEMMEQINVCVSDMKGDLQSGSED